MTYVTLDDLLYTDPLLDDCNDFVECGMEHPRLEGNLCINELNHKDPKHEDADGNVWTGQDWINNR